LSPFLSDIIPSLVSPLLWLQTPNPRMSYRPRRTRERA
jgi:hypothetical protein